MMYDIIFDVIEKIDNSVIQHGPVSDRIYLMKLNGQDLPALLDKLNTLADKNSYSKIFAKVPLQVKSLFERHDFIEEAAIPNFYHGENEGVFLAKYLNPERELDPTHKKVEKIIDLAEEKAAPTADGLVETPFAIRPADEADAEALAEIFKQVFESYPFPIHEQDYIKETMASHVQYFGAFDGEQLVAAGSAEMDAEAQNAELTDFATLPDYRGHGLALQLLDYMEKHIRNRDIKTGYTIARALSPGMNITFAKHGYQYAGTLTNNTNICGKIESMNVWYKSLDE